MTTILVFHLKAFLLSCISLGVATFIINLLCSKYRDNWYDIPLLIWWVASMVAIPVFAVAAVVYA